jgi:hypothetical protein
MKTKNLSTTRKHYPFENLRFRKWSVGETYRTKVELTDERDALVPAGSLVRIVAITPKVCLFRADGIRHDGYEYFYNAVRAEQRDFYERDRGGDIGPRIRANFCTLGERVNC